MKSRVVKAIHCRHTCRLRSIIYESTIAFGDEEQALDVFRSISRKVVFEISYSRRWWEVADPKSMARLFWFARWASRIRWNVCRLGSTTIEWYSIALHVWHHAKRSVGGIPWIKRNVHWIHSVPVRIYLTILRVRLHWNWLSLCHLTLLRHLTVWRPHVLVLWRSRWRD